MTQPLNNQQIRKLKGIAQRLEPIVHVGKEGITESLVRSVDLALIQRELVKVRFTGCKDRKKELAPLIAEKTDSTFVTRVGNVAVYFREAADPKHRRILA
jgi:RNA-binding protein